MTADAFEESIQDAKNAGMDGYLTKPVEPKSCLRRWRPQTALIIVMPEKIKIEAWRVQGMEKTADLKQR